VNEVTFYDRRLLTGEVLSQGARREDLIGPVGRIKLYRPINHGPGTQAGLLFDGPDGIVSEARAYMTAEAIVRFVIVIVGIHDPVIKGFHRSSLLAEKPPPAR
jgi:hypothetical protein